MNYEEQLEKLDQELARIKAKKQKITNAKNKKERAERTHRLIEIGALAEKYLANGEIHTKDEWEQFFIALSSNPDARTENLSAGYGANIEDAR